MRRYWEHLIREERDFSAHMGYVHINPLKHRLVQGVIDWPYLTVSSLVQNDLYPENCAGSKSDLSDYDD